ncbi:uncharacterized protein LOC109601093 [Aethina tumida]|uniref:uncharacterized protein LOC109601093 n=1 Tax=Aethina tumida TaxID=116153 RepID=UPI00096B4DA8|nr:uncharacterized protein LOC109601093 [Aethina tumida]
MFLKTLIILAVVANCWCYTWKEEAKSLAALCAKVNKAHQENKLPENKILKQQNLCLRTHVGTFEFRPELMELMTKKGAETDKAFDKTFKQFDYVGETALHDYITCMGYMFNKK